MDLGQKQCRLCGQVKPLEEFHRATTARDGHRGECKACFREQAAERYRADPSKAIERARRWQADNRERHLRNQRARRERPEVKAKERAGHLRRAFGITQERYEELLGAQDGGCAVCSKEPKTGKSLHVDHDHDTGAIRGLLCFSCNAALGHLREDEERIRALAAYLLAHDAEVIELAAITRTRLAALSA
jgi:hypothetical protein